MLKKIYCCGCKSRVNARLTSGLEVYSHRGDLSDLPFWICDGCGNFVGCHHKTKNRTEPLGCIPTRQIKDARKRIHALLDPIWNSGRTTRGKIYADLSKLLGKQYHTAEIRSIEEARIVYRLILQLNKDIK